MSDEQASAEQRPQDDARAIARALRKCTPKQRKWLRELATNDWQTYATAERLGYSSRTVSRWLRMEHVRHALGLLSGQFVEEARRAHAQVLQRYERLAAPFDIRVFFKEDGSLKLPHEWTAEMAARVIEYGHDADGKPRIKLINERKAANDALAKFQHLIVDRTEFSGPDGQPLPPPVINIVERADPD